VINQINTTLRCLTNHFSKKKTYQFLVGYNSVEFVVGNFTAYFFLILSIILGIASNSFLKSTNGFTIIAPTIFCIISIVACIFCLSKAMNIIPVGFAYATYGGLTITAVTLFGVFKYNQVPNFYGIVGVAFIIIGVILLNTLSKTT
jgi:small multidrug resistance pump